MAEPLRVTNACTFGHNPEMHIVTSTDGVQLVVHDLGGDGPSLLVAHATGLHARSYREFATHLTGRFHVVAPDFRGHGDSNEPFDGDASWYGAGRDIEHVAAALGSGPIVGFGHSMGATALLMAEHAHPGLFSAIVAYEPVIFPPDPPRSAVEFETRLVAATVRRRHQFDSPTHAITNFSAKPPFDTVPTAVIEDYVVYGMRPTPNGTVELKCRPEYEAATYVAGSKHAVWHMLDEIACPVLVLSGNVTHPGPGALANAHAARLISGSFHEYSELSHFGPLENAAAVAETALAFFASLTSAQDS